MKTESKTPTPKWFWAIAILALAWFLMDMSMFFIRTFIPETMLNGMPTDQQRLYQSMPSWVNAVFATEVFGGVLGSIALLLKKRWALILFGISLSGVLLQTTYLYFLSEAINVMGTAAIVMPLIAILIGAGSILFTKSAITKNWIR